MRPEGGRPEAAPVERAEPRQVQLLGVLVPVVVVVGGGGGFSHSFVHSG